MKGQEHATSSTADDTYFDDDRTKCREAVVPEADILQISQWTAHSDTIMSIQFIPITDEPLIFTASKDKFVHLFTLEGEPRGTLRQGYMMLDNYDWDFPVQDYNSQ